MAARAPQAEFVKSAVSPEGFLRDRPEVAFVGRSNVGKSTLLNRLLGRRDLARTSSTPGRTQAVNYFLVDRRAYFVDLPGYGFAKASKTDRQRWARLTEQYLEDAAGRALLVQLVDAKVGATDLDLQAAEYLATFGMPRLVVATKADKLPRARRPRAADEVRRRLDLADDAVILFSSVSGEGVPRLWKGILDFVDRGARDAADGSRPAPPASDPPVPDPSSLAVEREAERRPTP